MQNLEKKFMCCYFLISPGDCKVQTPLNLNYCWQMRSENKVVVFKTSVIGLGRHMKLGNITSTLNGTAGVPGPRS